MNLKQKSENAFWYSNAQHCKSYFFSKIVYILGGYVLGTIVKNRLRHLHTSLECRRLSFSSASKSSILLMCTMEDRAWWFMRLGHCHLGWRSRLSARILALPSSYPSHCGDLKTELRDFFVYISISLPFK